MTMAPTELASPTLHESYAMPVLRKQYTLRIIIIQVYITWGEFEIL